MILWSLCLEVDPDLLNSFAPSMHCDFCEEDKIMLLFEDGDGSGELAPYEETRGFLDFTLLD